MRLKFFLKKLINRFFQSLVVGEFKKEKLSIQAILTIKNM